MALVEGETLLASLQGRPLRASTATPAVRDSQSLGVGAAAGAGADDDKTKLSVSLVQSASSPKEHALYIFAANGSLHSIFPIYDTSIMKMEGSVFVFEGLHCLASLCQSDALYLAIPADSPHKAEFTEKCQSAVGVARREHFNSATATHRWIRFASSLPPMQAGGGAGRSEPEGAGAAVAGEGEGDDIDAMLASRKSSEAPQSMQSIRESWINSQMASRALEFTKMRSVSVCLGTYNVNGKYPVEEDKSLMDLRPWLRFRPSDSPDIYVLGFQELDLTAEAFIFNDSTREEDWSAAIEASFHDGHNYRKLKSKQLVGMLLMVYVRAELLPFIKDVQADAQGTGILGMMGNKGGVSVRFLLHDSSLCFVNSHLAAHDDEVKRRNQDHHEICRRVMFTRESGAPFSIFDHDHLFWVGDLNYRIPLPDAEVKSLARKGTFEKLLEFDQLQEQKRLRLAFVGFEEGPITFAPTYKYDPGTSDFDSSEKMRTPAYCDRIMHYKKRVREGVRCDEVSLQHYISVMDCKVSDHKPVRALYLVQLKVVEAERQREVYNSIVRQLDTIENKSLPDVRVSSNVFTFDNVRYLRPQKQTLTISNVGKVPARFVFLPKPDQRDVHKPWLWIEPLSDMIMPGASSEVSLSVIVDDRSACTLNSGKDKLEDILILHLENGRDLFITVSGTYLRTAMGTSLDDLVCVPTPVRALPPGPIVRKAGAADGVERLHIPKELWVLVDFLYRNGMATDSLFMSSGNRRDIWATIDCLDTGLPIPDSTDIHSVAETLVRFLDGLPEPVVPPSLYRRCLECAGSLVLCRGVISELPAVSQSVFIYLMAFLRELLKQTHRPTTVSAMVPDDNHVTPDKLALLFGSLLLRPASRNPGERTFAVPTGGSLEAMQSKKQAAFIHHFLLVSDSP
eukprot:m.20360 g.20360  ORF g.20360 m.20360 type:complete len:907 (+) comp7810_c0_seq1:39-2759(+)